MARRYTVRLGIGAATLRSVSDAIGATDTVSSILTSGGGSPTTNAYSRGLAWYQTNTGVPAGTSLTTQGATNYGTAGQTITARDFTGHVNVNASNVTFVNCVFRLGINMNANTILDHCTVLVPTGTAESVYMDQNGGIVRYCKLSGGYENIRIYGNNCTVQDNYLYGLSFTDSSGATHADQIYCPGGESGNSILRNWLDADGALTPGTGQYISYALNMGGWMHTANNFTVSGNHFTVSGTTGPYYLAGLGSGGGGTNVYTDNTWRDGWNPYYPSMDLPAGDVWSNNLYMPSGNPVPRP